MIRKSLQALKKEHRKLVSGEVAPRVNESLDLDTATARAFPNDPRWDYLLGITGNARLIALEPHSAKDDQISLLIRKKRASTIHLRPHLRDGAFVSAWVWVASNGVSFADTEKTRRRLDEHGITFAGRELRLRHIP